MKSEKNIFKERIKEQQDFRTTLLKTETEVVATPLLDEAGNVQVKGEPENITQPTELTLDEVGNVTLAEKVAEENTEPTKEEISTWTPEDKKAYQAATLNGDDVAVAEIVDRNRTNEINKQDVSQGYANKIQQTENITEGGKGEGIRGDSKAESANKGNVGGVGAQTQEPVIAETKTPKIVAATPVDKKLGSVDKKKAYDFDFTLYNHKNGKLTPLGEKVKDRIANGEDVKIVTSRNEKDIQQIKDELGIDETNIVATGNENKKRRST